MTAEADVKNRATKLRRIGRAIREWRESGDDRSHLSMEQLASKIRRSMSTVQRWDRGALEPKVSDLQRMDSVKPGLLERLFPRLERVALDRAASA